MLVFVGPLEEDLERDFFPVEDDLDDDLPRGESEDFFCELLFLSDLGLGSPLLFLGERDISSGEVGDLWPFGVKARVTSSTSIVPRFF